LKIKRKEKEYLNGLMEESIQVNGRMANNMVKEQWLIKMGKKPKGII
jgi:hypothetical protein